MNEVQFGLKLWSINTGVLKEASRLISEGIFQYVELLMVPDTEITPFLKLQVPYRIHVPHENFGVCIGDKTKAEFTKAMLQRSLEWADSLKAEHVILHASFGSMKDAEEFLSQVDDPRIVIENMPKVGDNNESMIGYLPEQIQALRQNRFGFCLDLNHAIRAAGSLQRDYKEYLKEFMALDPALFHLADGNLAGEKDEHKNIGEGEYDMKFLLSLVGQSAGKLVSLETPRKNLDSLGEDIENAKRVQAASSLHGASV